MLKYLLLLFTLPAYGQIYTVVTTGTPPVNPSDFPVVPAGAIIFSNLETQGDATACHTTADPTWQSQQGQSSNCWNADTVDATAAAGAGYPAPTLVNLHVPVPGTSPVKYGIQFAVANAPAVTPSSTVGASGASSVTVNSVSKIIPGAALSGTGIASGTNVQPKCASGATTSSCWDGSSTNIPLDTPLASAVTSGITFTPTITANALFFRHFNDGSASKQNGIYEFDAYLPATDTTVNAFEYDPDQSASGTATTTGGLTNPISAEAYGSYQFGIDKNSGSCKGTYPTCYVRLWNGSNATPLTANACLNTSTSFGLWFERTPAYGCSTNIRYQHSWTIGAIHHFKAYQTYTYDIANPANSQTCYQSLAIDGVTLYANINVCLKNKLHSNSTYKSKALQLQMDLTSATPRSSNALAGVSEILFNITSSWW